MGIKLNHIYPRAFVYKISYKDMKPYVGICGRDTTINKRFSEHKSHNRSHVTRLHQQSKVLFDEALKNDEEPLIECLEECEDIKGSELLKKEALYSIQCSSINNYSNKHF
tara:strand:+ start:2322 stop:2651 length:330 start_codon:yes stop_codon:yes gene_type:complete